MHIRSEHPLRQELHDELHARPSLYFEGESDVWHIAIVGEDAAPPIPETLLGLAGLATTQKGKHGFGDYGGGRLKWELHTEFLTLTFVIKPQKFLDGALPDAVHQLCELVEGKIIAAVLVRVRDKAHADISKYSETEVVGSVIGGGDAEVYSNFRLNTHGFVEFLLINRELNAYRSGRMVRRLLEIETYRMMAMLAMPMARATVARLAEFERRLSRLVDHMRSTAKVDKALLSEATQLSSDVLNFSALARARFGATKAYAEIVASRLAELREERAEKRQRIGTFIDRRFLPAVRSFQAAERRLSELAESVSLAGDLLRTSVQVQLEDQNASLLNSMAERTRVQVHIQQAVEGFSVIAITYYTIGLLKIGLESFQNGGQDLKGLKLGLAIAIPLVSAAVWWTVRRVRKRIEAESAAS